MRGPKPYYEIIKKVDMHDPKPYEFIDLTTTDDDGSRRQLPRLWFVFVVCVCGSCSWFVLVVCVCGLWLCCVCGMGLGLVFMVCGSCLWFVFVVCVCGLCLWFVCGLCSCLWFVVCVSGLCWGFVVCGGLCLRLARSRHGIGGDATPTPLPEPCCVAAGSVARRTACVNMSLPRKFVTRCPKKGITATAAPRKNGATTAVAAPAQQRGVAATAAPLQQLAGGAHPKKGRYCDSGAPKQKRETATAVSPPKQGIGGAWPNKKLPRRRCLSESP